MVVDTSAIFAAVPAESDSALYKEAIERAPFSLISATTYLETRIVVFSRIGPDALEALEKLIEVAGIFIIPFDSEQALAAFAAFKKYGKGQGHPAQLNIIDCAAYALASLRGLPLLYRGMDFAYADVISALPMDANRR